MWFIDGNFMKYRSLFNQNLCGFNNNTHPANLPQYSLVDMKYWKKGKEFFFHDIAIRFKINYWVSSEFTFHCYFPILFHICGLFVCLHAFALWFHQMPLKFFHVFHFLLSFARKKKHNSSVIFPNQQWSSIEIELLLFMRM